MYTCYVHIQVHGHVYWLQRQTTGTFLLTSTTVLMRMNRINVEVYKDRESAISSIFLLIPINAVLSLAFASGKITLLHWPG